MKPLKLLFAVLCTAVGISGWVQENAPRLAVVALVVTLASFGVIDPATAGMLIVVGHMNPYQFAGNAPFPIVPEQTAIALAYTNKKTIADDVLPRVPVGKQEFQYLIHTLADGFTVPDTKVHRRSSPGQVEFSAAPATGFTQGYGLDDVIPQDDIDNAPPNYDPVGKAVAFLTNLILLDREIRVANLVFNTATYAAGLTSTLAGVTQWSDYTNSDPLSVIMNALDTLTIRPNIAVFGRVTWTKLRMHPKIVQAVNGIAATGAGQSAGTVSRQQVAQLLELDDVLVGESFFNTAKKGQAASLSRVWGKHAAFLVRDTAALAGKGVTFGFTPQFRSRLAGSWPVKEGAGLMGGMKVRVGENVNEYVIANDCGYMFQNAVA
jgi:hypothetical protein